MPSSTEGLVMTALPADGHEPQSHWPLVLIPCFAIIFFRVILPLAGCGM